MSNIDLPIVIVEDDALMHFYRKIEDAEIHLEAIDVENGVYQGFDANGRLLQLSVVDQGVKISLSETSPTHQKKLIGYLKAFLKRQNLSPENDSLDDLMRLCEKYIYVPPKTLSEYLRSLIKRLFNR